ncbi:MAG: hypothetical protein CSA42_07050 [Gammaproteobacteria bacterium]|nr:MAG: hypothetical protein CSA42_07050 [Gammaproteobacteria bacterium]
MSDYVVCVRNIEKGKFGNEPGVTYFLEVPSNKTNIEVGHRVSKKSDWFKTVLKKGVVGTDIDGNEYGDILVFIHGYNNSQSTVLKRHRQIKKSLKKEGFKGEIVSFDWPSADRTLNYLEDRSDAKQTAIKLVDDCIKAFTVMQEDNCQINIHLLAHSTGAYVVREAFDDADDRPTIAASNWTVSQIMFIGADVSAKSMSLDNAKSSSIYRHCVRLTNYSNPFDAALKLSNIKRVGVAPRVGRIGLPTDIPENAVNVNCGSYYDENESFIEAIGTKSHSWYIGNDVFTKDMYLTIAGDIDRYSIPTRSIENGELHLIKS